MKRSLSLSLIVSFACLAASGHAITAPTDLPYDAIRALRATATVSSTDALTMALSRGREDLASSTSAPSGTRGAFGMTSAAKRAMLPAEVHPQVATENAGTVSSDFEMTSAGDSARAAAGCSCGLDTEGQDFCFQAEICGQLTPCAASTECGPGERCLANNCCAPPQDFACHAVCSGGCVGGGTCGFYQACTAGPPNDECVFAQDAAVPSQVIASTVGATFDAAPFCQTDNTAPGVWYRVMGTGNTIRASMCTEFVDFDTKISVFCAGCGVLTCVAGNDDGFCAGLPSTFSDVSWCSIDGTEYLVLVHGYLDQAGGAILNFSDDGDPSCVGRVSCVAGDDCGNANAIPNVPFSTTFDNSAALSGGAPGSCNSQTASDMDNDVWFSYTPRTNCDLSVTVNPDAGAGYDGIAAVYEGPDCLNLTELVCLDEPEPMLANVLVKAGMTYWIQMGDWGTFPTGGVTQLDVDCAPIGACCDDSTGVCQDSVSSVDCQAPNRFATNTLCSNLSPPCATPGEACCATNGSCTDVEPSVCMLAGATPQGVGTTCATVTCHPIPCDQSPFPACDGECMPGTNCTPNTVTGTCACELLPCGQSSFPICDGACPPDSICTGSPTGGFCDCQVSSEACCLPDGTCLETSLDECLAKRGNPHGSGSACATVNCPPATAIEIDQFDLSIGQLELVSPNGTEIVSVTGPATVHVFFEGTNDGDANDSDGDGREDVVTQMVDLQLTGISPSLGPILVNVHPTLVSHGEIEETVNNTAGLLDVDPFAPGTADSFFDLFFEIHVGGQVFFTQDPKRMSSLIHHKPPAPGDFYENLQQIQLYDASGNPTPYFLGATHHQPRPWCRGGDTDDDQDLDLANYADFFNCLTGPDVPATSIDCSRCFDYNGDGDVDEQDYAKFQQTFTGAQ